MSNTILTVDMIANRAIAVAHEKSAFLGTIYRDYDEEFGKSGNKVGDTIRIRKPNQYTRRQGSRVMDVQDQSEANTALTVATQDGVDMKFNSAELALSIDKFSERYIEPAMASLVSAIEGDVLAAMTKSTFNVVGSAGTVPGASGDISAFHNARARLNQGLAPKDSMRALQLDSVTMASVANGAKALFHDGPQVKEAFREGFYSRAAGADWYENERVLTLTNGSDVTGTTDSTGLGSANSDGSYSVVDMHTTVAVATQVVGEVFTIAAVYACHPETKQSLGYLQQFTITAIGASTTTVSPAIYLSGARQNVCKSDSTALATTDFNSATLTFIGSASTAYKYGLMYHRDAFAFATADLPLKADALSCVRKQYDGLSLRVWRGSDIRNDEDLLRIDILYGYVALKPEWACRIICN
jgi:hypothetical protein